MVKKKTSRDLLLDFIGEEISIITDMQTAVETDNGVVEIPLIIDGMLMDFDDCYLLVGQDMISAPQLVSRDRIISVQISGPAVKVMDDPNKPPRDSMN